MEALHPDRVRAERVYQAALERKREMHCGCDKATAVAALVALSVARRALVDAEAAHPTAAEAERLRNIAADRKPAHAHRVAA